MRAIAILFISIAVIGFGVLSAADKPTSSKADAKLRHWAFQPPVRPEPPKMKDEAWARNPIDRFILARLEKEGLKPAAEADRVTLIRRLSLDLTGLPPTIEEVDLFLREASAKPQAAYEQLVERLLASPHYGERWARLWLDAARYADSDGFEKDKSRQVWFYREWVINAFNRDLPYNQFIVEQIAGDLLPKATQDQIVATGFLRNSMINEEGGIDPEQFRMEAMFDRMDAIGKGMLGLTIQCTQCHDHKYDPISQADYYRMFAFLNDCHEANVAVYTPAEQQKRAEIFRHVKTIEDELRHRNPDWLKRMRAWEAEANARAATWTIVRPELDASGGQKHYLLDDGSILAAGYAPTKHTTEFTVKVPAGKITAVQLELLNDPNLPLGGPGRSIKGTFALSEFHVLAGPADNSTAPKGVTIARATADVNPHEAELEAIFDDRGKKRRVIGPIAYAIDGKNETAWSNDIGPGRSNAPRKAVFTFDKPIEFSQGTVLTFRLVQMHGGWNSDDNQNNNLGRFRLSVTDNEKADADSRPAYLSQLFKRPIAQRTPADDEALFSFWRTTVPEWKETNDQIERLWKEHPLGSSQLVLQARDMPRETHLLKRGDFLKPADKVSPGVPGVLHQLAADAPRDRLAFARWLADRRSPTTARAFINRVWQAYFGTGLVSSSEDFGTQSEPPSHPELLDWLAVEFMEPTASGEGKPAAWSLKHLHRLIILSNTYRQSSQMRNAEFGVRNQNPNPHSEDPENRLLARGPRFRVDAEVVRDIALSASGLLNPKIGGRSVFPPLPAFMLLPPVSYGPKTWQEDTGPERYRRSMYVFRYRSLPYPVLQTFDAPNGDFACVRRPRSNTPLQALMTLNEPIFVESARALALKALVEGGASDADRLSYAFRRCVCRVPAEVEKKALLALLAKQRERFEKPDAKPWELAAADPKNPPKLPEGVTPAQAAAWTIVARVLLNLDETITKEEQGDAMTREFDSPWKDALDLYLEWLLRWFCPDLHAAIDWSKGYESLDAELQQIVREAELGPVRADKLFRVYLRDGGDLWLLIHVEVQSQPDPDFARRMFVYYYRLVDRYNRDVVSLAILGDDQAGWRPSEYIRERFGCKVVFSFRTVKLLDWADRREELANGDDPIALVVAAHLESLLTHGNLQLRFQAKWRLIRHLLGLGWTAEQVRQLYRLIDWLLELPKELELQLREEARRYAEEKRMPYVPFFERAAVEEALQTELWESLEQLLELKFGAAGQSFAQQTRSIADVEKLRTIRRAISTAKTIDDLQNTQRYAEEKHKPYVPTYERLVQEEGRREQSLSDVTLVLETKFGEAGLAFAQELHAVTDLEKLREIFRATLRTAKTIDELRAMLQS